MDYKNSITHLTIWVFSVFIKTLVRVLVESAVDKLMH